MKRAALALLIVACGSPQTTTTTVPIALATADAAVQPHVVVEHVSGLSIVAYYHMCLLAHGKLRCRNAMTDSTPFSQEPVLEGLENTDLKQASLGRDYGCGVLRSGDVTCWGGNHFGQLGANVRDPQHPPIAVVNLHGVKGVFAGPTHACATLDGGRVACWGKNQFGENGSTTQYLEAARELVEPHVVPEVDGVVEMALGWDSTFAATSTGAVVTWGRKKMKDDPATSPWTEQPRVIPSLEGTTSLTSTEETFCGIQKDKVICWGQTFGFTDGMHRDEIITMPIDHPKRVRITSMYGCAVDASGGVWCFGTNTEGQLGAPPPAGNDRYGAVPPVKVAGIPRAVDVVTAGMTSCAITVSDELWCWGRFTYEDEIRHPPTRMPI